MSKCLVARYCPLEVVYLIPPDWDLDQIEIKRHNIYYKNKNVTDLVKSVELDADYKTPCDVYVDDGMKSFFESDDLMDFE